MRAAQGWFATDLPSDALQEIDAIEGILSLPSRNADLRWSLLQMRYQWGRKPKELQAIDMVAPNQISGSDRLPALHELASEFPDDFIIPYNLVCYLTQLGRLAEARRALNRAFEIKPQQRLAAAKDPDLKPLWMEI